MRIVAASDPRSIGRCVDAVNSGSIVVVPTHRWYMFAGRAQDTELSDTIFAIKRRPPSKSLLLVAPSRQWVESNFEFSDDAHALADAFWPGDLSFRLRWLADATPIESVGAPVGLVAVTDDLLGALATAVGAPLVSTSVNFAGTPAEGGTQPSFAFDQVSQMLEGHPLADRVAFMVDGGICPFIDATTVVDLTTPRRPKLERFGLVHRDAILHVRPHIDTARARRDMAGFDADAYRR